MKRLVPALLALFALGAMVQPARAGISVVVTPGSAYCYDYAPSYYSSGCYAPAYRYSYSYCPPARVYYPPRVVVAPRYYAPRYYAPYGYRFGHGYGGHRRHFYRHGCW